MYYTQLMIERIESPSKYLNNLSIHYLNRADEILRQIQQLQQLSTIKYLDRDSFCELKELGYIQKNGAWCNRLTDKNGLAEKREVFLQDSMTKKKKVKINRIIGDLFKVSSVIVKPFAMILGACFIPLCIICDLARICKATLSLFGKRIFNSYNNAASTQAALNQKIDINNNINIPAKTFFYKPRSNAITTKFKHSCRGVKISPIIKEHLYERSVNDQKELYTDLFNPDKIIEDLKNKCKDIEISYRSRSKKSY